MALTDGAHVPDEKKGGIWPNLPFKSWPVTRTNTLDQFSNPKPGQDMVVVLDEN